MPRAESRLPTTKARPPASRRAGRSSFAAMLAVPSTPQPTPESCGSATAGFQVVSSKCRDCHSGILSSESVQQLGVLLYRLGHGDSLPVERRTHEGAHLPIEGGPHLDDPGMAADRD